MGDLQRARIKQLEAELALYRESETIQWCEEHGSVVPEANRRCEKVIFAGWAPFNECRAVSKLLVSA